MFKILLTVFMLFFHLNVMAQNQVKVQISGMTCQSCVKKITEQFETHDAVKKIDINLKEQMIELDYDEKQLSHQQIQETIEELGYHFHSIHPR